MKVVSKWLVYPLLLAFVTIVILVAFPIVFDLLRARFFSDEDPVGDIFNAVSALFSALAFGLIILTVILQSFELSLQRSELEQTRRIFASQAATLAAQQFETTFFNLLALHNDIVKGFVLEQEPVSRGAFGGAVIEVSGQAVRYEGRSVLPEILETLGLEAQRALSLGAATNPDEAMLLAYDKTFTKHRDLLGHYFRNLYQL